jgi:hypothetical protein
MVVASPSPVTMRTCSRIRTAFQTLWAWTLLVTSVCAEPNAAEVRFFESYIRPLLSESCFECHGADKQKGGLRLDHIDFIKAGGEELGEAVTPANPHRSPLVVAVEYEEPDLEMPPDGKLPEAKIQLLRQWVEMGAPWPDEPLPGGAKVVRSGEFTEEERSWWAFQPVEDPPVPSAGSTDQQERGIRKPETPSPIDAFILAKLAEEGMEPLPLADRRELVRRGYFDLHGLPPTPEQVESFVTDANPRAWARLVDELLDSPRYGERMAQHWLDLVRYAESDGYRQDAYRPDAWPYRDYVIRSFNDDKPYDRFIREQIAGDELDPGNPEVLIGTAYLRHGIYEYNQRDVVSHWQLVVNELTDVTGDVFLGMSVQCAQCHNHKFDPILQKDYYRLQAFFSPIAWPEDRVLASPEERRAYDLQMDRWKQATVEPRKVIDAILEPRIEKAQKAALIKFPEDIQAMFAKPASERTSYEEQLVQFAGRQIDYERVRFKESKLPEEEQARLKDAREELARFNDLKPAPLQKAMVATDVMPVAVPTSFVTRRSGKTEVQPGFLSILDREAAQVPSPAQGQVTTGRRTVLANWLADPGNPLSTRVIVNRIWQYHFGRGIVATASDFGTLGEVPSHPELLDWLTTRFLEDGWSLKALHKRILLSAAYRRTSRLQPGAETARENDPENRLLWRFSPRRLDAEQARDAILAASGELDLRMGGPSVTNDKPRRSIYTRKLRNTPDPVLSGLDAPPGFASVPLRDATTTATQSLMLVNGDWSVARARAMALKLARQFPADQDESLIEGAYRTLFGREPGTAERRSGLAFLQGQADLLQSEAPPPPAESSPIVDGKRFFGDASPSAEVISVRPSTSHEKLIIPTGERREGEEFVVEAVIWLDSLYPNASVRTIASRWDNNKTGKGWSFGITSSKSAYQPRNLIIQLSGDDFQGSHNYEVVASDLRIPLQTPYFVAAVVSNRPVDGKPYGGSVTFVARDLSRPDSVVQKAVVPHEVVGGYVNPAREFCVGGRDRTFSSGWDGVLGRVALRAGTSGPTPAHPWKTPQGSGQVIADVTSESVAEMTTVSESKLGWSWETQRKSSPPGADSASPRLAAIIDFCHALLNANEFFYLH